MARPETIGQRQPKGVVILFGIFVVIIMLAVGGVAIDVAALLAGRSEMHRATDAASLAGAGNIAFDSSVFPAVRAAAVTFGGYNPTRFGPVNLDPNNDVILGTWTAGAFTPWDGSLNGTQVNAVLCRTARNIPTSFLRIIGVNAMPMSAQSIAVAHPPSGLPPTACMFPMGVTACQFMNAGAWTSQGCGTAMTFATSSGQSPDTQAGTNTGAWINPTGTGTPNASTLRQWLAAAANGTGCQAAPAAGTDVGANNGMIQPVVNDLEDYFIPKYEASSPYTINGTNGESVYEGKGWQVYIPVIQTDCPPQAINQAVEILTYTRFVITQVINGGNCAVNNPNDPNSFPLCPAPNGPNTNPDPSLRAIFGYFDCTRFEAPPNPVPAPVAALAERLRLVQ